MPSIINATTSTGLVTTADNSGSLQLATNSGTTALTIDTSQRVGIGTSSPARTLDVLGGSNTQFRVSSTGAEANMTLNGTSYGQINNAVGDLYISTDASSSNMIFRTNGGFERMRIDSSGRVTAPFQPVFTASVTNGNTATSGTIIYNSANINVGSCYNTSNGRFTAPVAGIYIFSITGISVNTTTVESSIMVNGSGTFINARGGSNTSSTAAGYCGVVFISLSVNDYVSVRIDGGTAQYGFGNFTTFSGRLMQ